MLTRSRVRRGAVLIAFHALSELVSEVINVDLSGGGVVDDADENVVQVVNLLLAAIELLQVLNMTSVGKLQLVIL